MSREATLDVFFSYSHRDAKLREQLEKHLALLKRRQVIRTWSDGEIRAGDEWSRSSSASWRRPTSSCS